MLSRPLLLLPSAAALLLVPSPATADPVTLTSIAVVDTLGAAGTATRFNVGGSAGVPFFGLHSFGTAFVGPQFTLTRPSIVTRVGGYVNSCESIVNGVPQCVPASAIGVQIRPAQFGDPAAGPDPNQLLASATLSHDDDPFTIGFESASLDVLLQPGTYYALFTLPPGEGGFILSSAQEPFLFTAGAAMFGSLKPGVAGFVRLEQGAVRVDAAPIPEPSTLSLLLSGSAAAALRRRSRRVPERRASRC
ncbi:MAG TPA: PEP-CTERM sorting domain-containing protein [Vicinamibacterales bacterium]|nr:PEP-CTERM sorting domain-containing protein [Vicinamibacterales bacterium]